MQQRRLKNVCLSYLGTLQDQDSIALLFRQFNHANHMTDQYAALRALSHCDCPQRQQALDAFEAQWQHDNNVMDKWFAVQASAALPDTLQRVRLLLQHPRFDLRNPNKVRALIGSFAMRNPAALHAPDGSGYSFIAEQVIQLDHINPQVAARMVRSLMHWKRLEPGRSARNRAALQHIADHHGLSGDVYEIVSKSLL